MLHQRFAVAVYFFFLTTSLRFFNVTSTSSRSITLRVRFPDGSMKRISSSTRSSLREALAPLMADKNEDLTIRLGATELQIEACIEELGLEHGSLLSLVSKTRHTETHLPSFRRRSFVGRFDPFPELAKDYEAALQQLRLSRRGTATYADIENLQAQLHRVEPQDAGPLKRLYLCQISAERFAQQSDRKYALLLGTTQREPNDSSRPPTVLQRPSTEADYCHVAKVQAIHEASTMEELVQFWQKDSKVRQVSKWLGLECIGWMFSYVNEREMIPLHSKEIVQAAKLQIERMKATKKASFLTVALHRPTGATEAFQISDVCVQMVAEDNLLADGNDQQCNGRLTKTRHSIIVDGKETKDLDTVLCVINTALLADNGTFAAGGKATRKSGGLTKKARKAVASAVDNSDFSMLCSFSILLGLYQDGLSAQHCEELCLLVRKWTKGQAKGLAMNPALKQAIRSLVVID